MREDEDSWELSEDIKSPRTESHNADRSEKEDRLTSAEIKQRLISSRRLTIYTPNHLLLQLLVSITSPKTFDNAQPPSALHI